jgi:hypothetical protein
MLLGCLRAAGKQHQYVPDNVLLAITAVCLSLTLYLTFLTHLPFPS